MGVLGLSYTYQISDPALKRIWPRLVQLRDLCGQRCSFCVLDGTHIIHLLHVQSGPHRDFRAALLGLRLPALSTSGGLAMLSTLPEPALP